MKKIHFILFAIAMLIVLLLYANWILKQSEEPADDKLEMTYNNLFVRINSDTLVFYLNTFKENHPSLVIKDNSHDIVIEHNRHALILLNAMANDMLKEREEFVKSGIITESDNKTILKLKKSKEMGVDYVDCPAPILAEILRIKTENQSH